MVGMTFIPTRHHRIFITWSHLRPGAGLDLCNPDRNRVFSPVLHQRTSFMP